MPTQENFNAELAYKQSIATAIQQNAKTISLTVSCLDELYCGVGLPLALRCFTQIVVGVAQGELDWFTASDGVLGERVFWGERDKLTRTALKRRCQTLRASYVKWQNKTGYLLTEVKTTPGIYLRDSLGNVLLDRNGKPKVYYEPTQYKLPILAKAAELMEEAQLRRRPADYIAMLLSERLRFTPETKEPEPIIDYLEAAKKPANRAMKALGKAIENVRLSPVGDPRRYLRSFFDQAEKQLILEDDPQVIDE